MVSVDHNYFAPYTVWALVINQKIEKFYNNFLWYILLTVQRLTVSLNSTAHQLHWGIFWGSVVSMIQSQFRQFFSDTIRRKMRRTCMCTVRVLGASLCRLVSIVL